MKIRQFFAIVELRTKVVSTSTFVLALLYSIFRFGSVPLFPVLLTFAAALAVDMGTTAFNSYFDFLRTVDHAQENREKDKVLIHEGVSPRNALLTALGCYAAAVFLGGNIALLKGWEIAAAGAVCMLVGFLYTGGPYPISRTPFGEIFAGGFLGSVFFLIVVYILTGSITGEAVLASLPSTFMIASILSVNNACDIRGDTRAGRHTLAILAGPVRAARLVPSWGVLTLIAVFAVTAGGDLPRWTYLTFPVAALPAVLEYRRMFTRGFEHDTKRASMQSILRIFMLFTAAYAAALLASIAGSFFKLY